MCVFIQINKAIHERVVIIIREVFVVENFDIIVRIFNSLLLLLKKNGVSKIRSYFVLIKDKNKNNNNKITTITIITTIRTITITKLQ